MFKPYSKQLWRRNFRLGFVLSALALFEKDEHVSENSLVPTI